jgi:phosphate transport system substrate-binding protein
VIKQLHPHFETEEELQAARGLFDIEAKVLYRLGEHDQIPRLMAHFEEQQKFYFVQELIEGTPLDQLFNSHRQWSEAEVVVLLKDLLEVLAFVHQQGVIHRNIKPSNLICRHQDDKIVLIDFGVVQQVNTQGSGRGAKAADLTISFSNYGYTASEQLAGNPQFNSDVYAVGLVAIQALTNIHPKQLQRDPVTHELQWQVEGISVSPELAAVIDRMVHFDFRKRYASADKALVALWSNIPINLLGSLSKLKISEEAVAKPQSRRISDTTLLNLRPVFLSSLLRNWRVLGGLAVASFMILLVTYLLVFRSGSIWSDQYSNLDPGNTKLSGKPNFNKLSTHSASNANSAQDNSTALSQPDSFASIENVPSGLFSYGGSTTWAPIRKEVDSIVQAANPGFELRYTEAIHGTPGSGTGIRMLLQGQLAFVQSSRPLTDKEYQEARLHGFGLKQIPVALDAIAIAVHPNLGIPGLTLHQIRDIYMSKITNWKQVGGPNLTITPYSRNPMAGGTPRYFADEVLNGGSFGKTVKYVYSTTDGIRKLSITPGGIYYASATEIVPQCEIRSLPITHLQHSTKFVSPYIGPLTTAQHCSERKNQLNQAAFRTGEYPLTRQLFVIVKQDGLIDQQAGEAYSNLLLTNEGQKLITKAGFVRIH